MTITLLLAASLAGGADGPPHAAPFPPGGPPVLWVRDLGQGYSGFAADGGHVFTQSQTLAGGQAVLCLDARTGETVWRHRYAGPFEPAGLYPGPRSTPAVHGGRVFFTTPAGVAGCLDAATGDEVWSVDLYRRFEAEPVAFGYSCSPVPVTDDGAPRVFLPVGGDGSSVVALDAATGATVWAAGDDAASHVAAVPVRFGGRPLVVGYLRNALVLHDRRTGERVGRRRLSTGYDEHAAVPVYREPHLWISGPFRGGSELLELRAGADGGVGLHTVWKRDVLSNDVCSSVLAGDHLYGFDLFDVQAKPHRPSRGAFRCVDFLTGETRWSVGDPGARRDPADDSVVGQATVLFVPPGAEGGPSLGSGLLILLNDTGDLILARATPGRYAEIARTPLLTGGVVWTRPTLHRGRLYARDHGRAVCAGLWDDAGTDVGRPSADPPLRTTDLPRSPAGNWAAFVLPVEPEYMMDAPTRSELTRRFAVCLALLLIAALGAAAGAWRPRDAGGARFSVPWFRRAMWGTAFLFGAGGTTVLGHRAGEYVFTWPLAVFAAFHATARLAARPGGSRKDDLALVAFAALCGGYFLLCRRLSLAFEWASLAALPAALPAAILPRRLPPAGWRAAVGEVASTALGFAAFTAATAAVLWWWYG